MPATIALVVIIVMIAGGFAGWHWRSAVGANADVKLMKGRLPALRRGRLRHTLIALALVVIAFLALKDMMHP